MTKSTYSSSYKKDYGNHSRDLSGKIISPTTTRSQVSSTDKRPTSPANSSKRETHRNPKQERNESDYSRHHNLTTDSRKNSFRHKRDSGENYENPRHGVKGHTREKYNYQDDGQSYFNFEKNSRKKSVNSVNQPKNFNGRRKSSEENDHTKVYKIISSDSENQDTHKNSKSFSPKNNFEEFSKVKFDGDQKRRRKEHYHNISKNRFIDKKLESGVYSEEMKNKGELPRKFENDHRMNKRLDRGKRNPKDRHENEKNKDYVKNGGVQGKKYFIDFNNGNK